MNKRRIAGAGNRKCHIGIWALAGLAFLTLSPGVAARAGAEECPLNSLWSQLPEGALEWSSDVQANRAFADNFYSLNGPIYGVRWWGYYTGGSLAPCTPDPNQFKVAFYANNSGEPGALVAEHTVTPTVLNTGSADPDSGLALYRHDVAIDPPLALEDGWVSIAGAGGTAGCEFLPASSTQDGVLRYFVIGGIETVPDTDAAWCLTGWPGEPLEVCEGNLLQDGSFELGRPNPHWEETFDPGFTTELITLDAPQARSGSYFANMGESAEGDDLSLTQPDVVIPAGSSATLWFYLRVFTGGFTSLTVKVDGIAVYSLAAAQSGPYTVGYERVTVDLSGFADGAAHELSFHTWAMGGYTPCAHIDDVCLTTIANESCPLNSLWSQVPLGALPLTSDAQSGRAFADNFFSLNGPIHDVHWWGYYRADDESPCMRDPNQYIITFRENDSGEPGAFVAEYTVTPAAVDTGILHPDLGVTLFRHDADIVPPLALETGWVSIQGTGDTSGCEFLPASSNQDGVLRYLTTGGVEVEPDVDAAWCLTGSAAEGEGEGEGEGEDCANFDDLVSGTEYHVGDIITTQGYTLSCKEFFWLPSGSTVDGVARVGGAGDAGGAGLELSLNNINVELTFVVPAPLSCVSFRYGEYGGNLNLEVNGDFRNFEDFADIHGSAVGGVTVHVMPDGANTGTVELRGPVTTLKLGGQEFFIDDLCPYCAGGEGEGEGEGEDCANFDDLVSGSEYHVGDIITTQGYTLSCKEFFWLPSGSTVDGVARVGGAGDAGGSGLELSLGNINVELTFVGAAPPSCFSFRYGEYGGNLNLEVNGDFRNFEDFADIHGSVVGGVAVHVIPDGANTGTVELRGPVTTLKLGGQEFFIDDLCPYCAGGEGEGEGEGGDCADFDDLVSGTEYQVGDIFATQGYTLSCKEFFWLPSGSTVDGVARVGGAGDAGGSGLELSLGNINVELTFVGAAPPSCFSFRYGEYGGNLNLEVNGDFRNFEDFADIHGSAVGGATVHVMPDGANTGTVELRGPVTTLKLGGQEFFIDDLCPYCAGGEGEGEGEGEGGTSGGHTADQNGNSQVELPELLRLIQFFNVGGFHCAGQPGETEDGYVPGAGTNYTCATHASDYHPDGPDWKINLTELLRLIQFFNTGGYHPCPGAGTEDGFCPEPA